MRLCSNRIVSALLLFALAPLAGYSQTAAPSQQPAATSTPTRPVLRPETQAPLNEDRDPVTSPDAVDNLGVSPENPGAARQSAQDVEKGSHGYTLTRTVDEVVLNATVLDENRRLVTDLSKDDFKIWEDNVPQTIASFQHQDIPVSMGILVDNSGSMRDKRAAVNNAALDLVKASNPEDEAFIVNFSDEAFIDQDFTSNLDKLREGLSHIDSKGGTALYDAVVASADQMAKSAKRSKQVLLVITDGEDNASSLTIEQTIRRVQQLQGPIVYSIGLLFGEDSGGRESKRARRALQLLSDDTGGLAFFPRSLGEVDEIAAEVARDIRNQYTIGYHSTRSPEEGGGAYRTIRVDAHAQGHGKLIVRTRSGYYPKANQTTAKPAGTN
ncbi:VWA domain-containing protein [Silvibacterium sp.]|uniref:VWA domain-containing protein n=1 Tax=Silvibacterium sp. TaxID=1964179 RepID=UPI0039E3F0F3